jgi:flagellar biogenesis protein FliO
VPQAEVATGTESASDRTNENSTHPTDSTAVVPANHLTDIEFHVGLNPSARPNNTDPPIEIQDRAKYRIPDNHRNREQDLPADSGGPTLAELLADSSREIVFDPAPDNNQKSRPGSLGQVDPKGLNSTDPSRSELASRTADTSALAETMQRIAVSLCFVLAVACVLLLVIKRWLFSRTSLIPKTGVVKPNRDSTSIRILNQLRLDAKSLLYLIKANEQQVLVAVDMAGIKSVVTLNSDFESALEDLSEQQAIRPRSIVEQLEAEFGQPATYSPSTLQKKSGRSGTADDSAELLSSATAPARPRQHAEVKAESDLESEMKRKLAEILRSSLSNNSR